MARKQYKLEDIEDSEIQRLKNYYNYLPETKLKRNSDFCHIWNGPEKKGYGITQIHISLKKGGVFPKNFLVHRLSFFAKTQSKGFEKEKKMDVSHLCGVKLCSNPDHLVYESHKINTDRITCHKQGHCKGTHSPKCLFKQ